MVNSRFHFYLRFLSVAIVVSNLLLSAPDVAEAQFLAADAPRCPESHPFAYNVGRGCCDVPKGKETWNGPIVEWTNRKMAWDAYDCGGNSEPCKTQMPEYTGAKMPCENFHASCTPDVPCAPGYGECVDGSCVTKCDPDTQFTCKVSGMCHDKGMTCNGVYDCRNWYEFNWDDDSDESKDEAGCEWCMEGDPCSAAGETCQPTLMGEYNNVQKCEPWYGVCKA